MQVTFTRTAERRYRVRVDRDMAPSLVMDPAPGYDPYLPHDLLHFIVEGHWGLQDGIFGQLAAGGDAKTFELADQARDRRQARRQVRRSARRNRMSGGDIALSEKLAGVALTAWMVHTGRLPMPENAGAALEEAGVKETDVIGVLDRLDESAHRWHSLAVGEPLTLTWPWPERRSGRRTA
ncbi:hypothetical protein [Streptomyces johnsoniae]|uniref:Uncharacterized protein n=1 Tax=Streptomyces johnsoniae TaxID=3075532 RepID=A0ABU2SDI6_9ACTN|nr:hypothetical protein [Streptomyces sp. DSM 41886]MDT0446731.1 hypothetical protein [Streptomyces sp. DSM 41886]